MGNLRDREIANPWTSPTVLKARSGKGYQEPDMDEDDDISQATASYPPPSQNPFNQSRPSVQRIAIGERPSESGSLDLDQKRIDDSTAGTSPVMDTPDDTALPTQQVPVTRILSPSSGIGTKIGKTEHVILGIAVVDFNHLVGPTVDWSYPPSLTKVLSKDEELTRLLPFLALPDGAHLSEEDYSYFHCVYSPTSDKEGGDAKQDTSNLDATDTDFFPANQTIFGISPADVTRSTVQKAVVVLASRPVFLISGYCVLRVQYGKRAAKRSVAYLRIRTNGRQNRDKLGVVTRAFFAQRTLTLVKMMMLQKRVSGPNQDPLLSRLGQIEHLSRVHPQILFYGYPVEKLCTYQYSLISLMPGLLLNLADAGDPSLDFRKKTANKPTSLRTSDRNSLLRYMGLPLHTFGKQIDMLKAKSWLVGTTNSIVTQQRDCQWDLLIDIEQNTFEFHDKEVEKLVTLTPSDRAWMDQVVRSVEDTWNPASTADPTRPMGMVFRGSDDDLRSKFEEYICSVLATLKYSDYIKSGQTSVMPGGESDDLSLDILEVAPNFSQPYSEKWLEAFRQTPAYDIWNGSTDDLLFDICEPRHPCEGKTNAVSDIGIRLAEGFHDLHLQDQLGPTREAIGTALAAGSSSLFRAFDGVRSEVASRLREREAQQSPIGKDVGIAASPSLTSPNDSASITSAVPDIKSTLGGFGSFFGSKLASIQQAVSGPRDAAPSVPTASAPLKTGLRPLNLSAAASPPKTSRNSRPPSSG
ncbi:hypothetical protein QFC21_000935 [Naganishia friedmannii]|uniref:Uncharacterized protein n=1 Tax=Naganishia friedmannii TaxID=89922 RepID=A0ACC2W768_9TREE|nr:hypothetical protein QFC21_000935 [Naganishia friedmannii]